MKYTKQLASVLTAAVLLLSGCGTARESIRRDGATLQVDLINSYASSPLVTESGEALSAYGTIGDKIIVGQIGEDGMDVGHYLYDPDTGALEDLPLQYREKYHGGERQVTPGVIQPTTDGGLLVFYNDYTVDSSYRIHDLKHYVEIYDSEMQLVSGTEVPADYAGGNAVFSSNSLCFDKDGYSYYPAEMANDDYTMDFAGLVIYDENFEKAGYIQGDFTGFSWMFTGTDGYVYAAFWRGDDRPGLFGRLNPETQSVEEIRMEGLPDMSVSAYIPGCGEYDFFANDLDGLQGVKLEEEVCEEVVNWGNSDFDGSFVMDVIALSDGRFVIETTADQYTGISGSWLLRRRTEEEIAQMQLISLATLEMPDQLELAVLNFNRSAENTRIVVSDYAKYNTETDDTLGLEQFKQDMTNGIVADIICTSGLPFNSFANKGLFEDLYSFMEEDETFSEDDYLMNFFETLEHDGALRHMSFSYTVGTQIAKTEHAGTEQGRDIAAYTELITSLPEGMDAFGEMYRDTALKELCIHNMNAFIDTKKNKCSFDSGEFVKVLELCALYPEMPEDMFANMTAEELEAYLNESGYAYRKDEALLYSTQLMDPYDYHGIREVDFGDAEITLVGYPTVDGDGNGGVFFPEFTIAMATQSKYQEEVWSFFQYMLGEDYQRMICDNAVMQTMPVHRGILAEEMQAATEPDTYLDWDGKEVQQPRMSFLGSTMITLKNATPEEMDALLTYFEGITVSNYYDAIVYDIIEEEAGMYFAGDQTAEEAAEMIQSRVSIYLSEQAG